MSAGAKLALLGRRHASRPADAAASRRDQALRKHAGDRRHVTLAEKSAILDAYSIPRSQAPFYEFDHLVPLAIGGANSVANLWPQPWAEADQKDALEVDLQRQVCTGLLSQAKAQREVADDWVAAYTRYVGGVPAAVAASAARARPTLRARIAAAAWRWARQKLSGAEKRAALIRWRPG